MSEYTFSTMKIGEKSKKLTREIKFNGKREAAESLIPLVAASVMIHPGYGASIVEISPIEVCVCVPWPGRPNTISRNC